MTVLEWLLDSDPAIRWQALRDLVHALADIVAGERARVATEGWGAALLALQGEDGQWAGGACFPAQSFNWRDENQGWSDAGLPAKSSTRLAAVVVSDQLAPRRAAWPRVLPLGRGCAGPAMDEAIAWLRSRQQPDGSWLLENTHPGKVTSRSRTATAGPAGGTRCALRVLGWCERSA